MTKKRTAGALGTLALRGVPFAAPVLGLLLLPASALAADFVVQNLDDSGAGSLRQAILDADNNNEADMITFAAGGTIFLSSGQLRIETDPANLTIDGDVDGDGTPDITVDAQNNSGVFLVGPGADATLQALVITGGNASDGGGILNLGTLAVEGSTISGNHAGGDGGGIDNAGTPTSAATATITNSTISGNSAGSGGGGIMNRTPTLEIKSTIVAGNTAEDCANTGDSTITSLGFNLVGVTDETFACDFTADTDQQNVAVADVLVTAAGDPVLADNGGPTETIALVDTDTNPAVDAIPLEDCTDTEGAPVTTDQRIVVERPQPAGGNCDIGAFELVQESPLSIDPVIELFDTAVEGGTLMGAGAGNSGPGRLNALRNQLLTAGAFIEQGDIEAACAQLQDAAERTDGVSPPPDFVTGEAADDLFDAITGLQDDLGCFG